MYFRITLKRETSSLTNWVFLISTSGILRFSMFFCKQSTSSWSQKIISLSTDSSNHTILSWNSSKLTSLRESSNEKLDASSAIVAVACNFSDILLIDGFKSFIFFWSSRHKLLVVVWIPLVMCSKFSFKLFCPCKSLTVRELISNTFKIKLRLK